jgi:hypothetical protein
MAVAARHFWEIATRWTGLPADADEVIGGGRGVWPRAREKHGRIGCRCWNYTIMVGLGIVREAGRRLIRDMKGIGAEL